MAETLLFAAILALIVADLVVAIVALLWLSRLGRRGRHATNVPVVHEPRWGR